MPNTPENTKLRATRASREASDLSLGPGVEFGDIAERYGISLEYLARVVERERRSRVLTPHQKTALIAYAGGLQFKEIAETIGGSYRTIESHIAHCGAKLGLTNRVLALHYCLLAEWIEVGAGLSERARASALSQRIVQEVR